MNEDRSGALIQGLIAGMIGYFVFVAFFAILNLVSGAPAFHTASALGNALFDLGSSDDITAAIAYNGVHMLASLAMGTIASFLILLVDLNPNVWYVVMFLFIAGLLYGVGLGGIVANELAGVVTWGQVVIVNVLAAVLSGAYLWKSHPMLKDRVRRVAD